MKQFISVNQKRLNILLFFISFLFYSKFYWVLYEFIFFRLLSLPMELTTILDLIAFVFFLCSVIPCSFLIKYVLLKVLTN